MRTVIFALIASMAPALGSAPLLPPASDAEMAAYHAMVSRAHDRITRQLDHALELQFDQPQVDPWRALASYGPGHAPA